MRDGRRRFGTEWIERGVVGEDRIVMRQTLIILLLFTTCERGLELGFVLDGAELVHNVVAAVACLANFLIRILRRTDGASCVIHQIIALIGLAW